MSNEIIGRDIELGLSVEQTRGTPQSTAEIWVKNVACNITEEAEHAVDDNSHGVLEDSDNRRVVKKWVEGNVEGIVKAGAVGYLLYNLYGAVSSTWLASGVYQHIFTLSQAINHASLGIFVKDGDAQQVVCGGGMVSSLEINATQDDFVRFSASLMARSASDNSDTPSYSSSDYDFVAKDITVKIADTEEGLSGASETKIKDLSVNLDPGLIVDHVLGNENPDDIYNAKMSIEGSFSKNFNDETFKDLFLGDSAKYMQITIQGDTDLGGGNYPAITILLYKVKITGWDRSGGNDELVTENVEFKAFYNSSDAKASQITIVNKISEYDSAPSA